MPLAPKLPVDKHRTVYDLLLAIPISPAGPGPTGIISFIGSSKIETGAGVFTQASEIIGREVTLLDHTLGREAIRVGMKEWIESYLPVRKYSFQEILDILKIKRIYYKLDPLAQWENGEPTHG